MKLKIAIVTPVTDGSKYLDEAIASIVDAGGTEITRGGLIEIVHVVVHDGSDQFAQSIKMRYPQIRLVRGEGRGACAAAILGFSLIDADFFIQVNSDDRLGPGCLDILAEKAAARPDIQIWTGGTVIFETDETTDLNPVRALERPEDIAFTLTNLLDDLPCFTARFCHRSLYEAIGGLDQKFIHCNDRELMVRAFMANISEATLGCVVSEMRIHDGSKTLGTSSSDVPEFMLNHLELADLWLGCAGLPAPIRRMFKAWRARELLRGIIYEVRSLHLLSALGMIWCETRRFPLWPVLSLSAFAAVRRRRRTSSF